MRLRWVGDSRDYVKWDCVFENASGRFVFYVPMLRCNVDPICKHPEVQRHFDQRKSLDQFRELFPEHFAVFSFPRREYSISVADEYFRLVTERIGELQQKERVLVFIDPDTGIEPASGAQDEHLRAKDLFLVWKALRAGDKLIVYQHASRKGNWRQYLGRRAGQALQIDPTLVPDPYYNEDLARDVCFLVLEKPES
jgi:hypothetical protein